MKTDRVKKSSFFTKYKKLTRRLNQAYMQFNTQSHHIIGYIVSLLKSSLSIKIDLV